MTNDRFQNIKNNRIKINLGINIQNGDSKWLSNIVQMQVKCLENENIISPTWELRVKYLYITMTKENHTETSYCMMIYTLINIFWMN